MELGIGWGKAELVREWGSLAGGLGLFPVWEFSSHFQFLIIEVFIVKMLV